MTHLEYANVPLPNVHCHACGHYQEVALAKEGLLSLGKGRTDQQRVIEHTYADMRGAKTAWCYN